ncbi:MAG: monovalent cation/H(+) antiporter subunit G [Kutzneria sp.]|nr:monovalent cation/H(+) antiporter subunit G [Kutzneria sp.]MBV9847941.1 monovalent cation/H(+) antiporter subunit G [Kutzneria sp.]
MMYWVLLGLGCVVTVSCTVAATLTGDLYRRLHLLTPVTSLGAPLVGLTVALANGLSLVTGLVLLTVALLMVSGPVLGSAIGHCAAARDGSIQAGSSS